MNAFHWQEDTSPSVMHGDTLNVYHRHRAAKEEKARRVDLGPKRKGAIVSEQNSEANRDRRARIMKGGI